MAQQTALSVMALPGPVHSFVAKEAAPEPEPEAVVPSGIKRPIPITLGLVTDKSFPTDLYQRALDVEAQKMRFDVNRAMRELEAEEEMLIEQLRRARGNIRIETERAILRLQQKQEQLKQSRSDISRMQMKPRLEKARQQINRKPRLKKTKKDRRPKLTKLKKKQYKGEK